MAYDKWLAENRQLRLHRLPSKQTRCMCFPADDLPMMTCARRRSQEDGKDIKDLKGSVFRERAAEAQTPKLSRIQEHAVGTAIKGSRLKVKISFAPFH